MKGEREIKELLIQNTVQLIADGGFEKATTKAITHSGGNLDGIKMNEVYIYRLFGSKDHLYEEAFKALDDEFLYGVRVAFEHVHDLAQSPRDKMYIVFEEAWHFVLQNEAHCRCVEKTEHYVVLTVWSEKVTGTCTVTFPNGLLPDNTDPILAGVTTGQGSFTDSASFVGEYASRSYRFFIAGGDTTNYTEASFGVTVGTTEAE